MINITSAKTRVTKNLLNIPGWRTKRKIVVIESDDWGTIRMPSRAVYEKLRKAGYPVDEDPYSRFDAPASEEDLALLFELLSNFKDKNGRPPAITANNIVANPDFEKIRAADFREYHYELFPETLQRYPKHAGALQLWKEGMEQGLFRPQFHGREHLKLGKWMSLLQKGDKAVRLAFDHQMISINESSRPNCVKAYMDALNVDTPEEQEQVKEMLQDGLSIFEKLWGYPSRSFIAPCYFWPASLEPALAEAGVRFLQGISVQKDPVREEGRKFRKRYHYLGQRNTTGQLYLVRNCFFEPSLSDKVNWVSNCLREIATAFRWQKPAVICMHRLNFIGFIGLANRDNTLKQLRQLLTEISRRWPEVEFLASDQLGETINT